ncbi:MAG: hypothetical protein AB7V22_10895 [Kiritimatiellia bacterium]
MPAGMQHLRQAAARERRAPIFWWLGVMAATGAWLVWMVHARTPEGAVFLAVVLAAAWGAPLVALQSLSMPRRPKDPPPGPGAGPYRAWRKQARLLGRLLLYYEDNPDLPPDLRRSLRAARADLRDTLKAHPLRDDLERVCGRIRVGAVQEIKKWFWQEYAPRIWDLVREYEHRVAGGDDEDARILARQDAVERAAVLMSRCCMPRMLERERLACATDCAWLAATAGTMREGPFSCIELSAIFVIFWSDFSEPWRPARAIRLLARYLQEAPESLPVAAPEPAGVPAPPAPPDDGAGEIVVRNGKRYRRVRVRHPRRQRSRRNQGPSIGEIVLSFGQWIRYSIRAWMLYR